MGIAPFEQSFAHDIYKQKYAHEGEEWGDTAKRVSEAVLPSLFYTDGVRKGKFEVSEILTATQEVRGLIEDRKFVPGGRYLYAAGREFHQTQNCLLLIADDTREGWSDLVRKATMALMTGAGIGVEYSAIRPSGSYISRTGGIASGPISLMKMVNEVGRNVMQGGSRRSAIWAGLAWNHGDVEQFIRAKDWPPHIRELKDKDFTFPADLDMTNISVRLDDEFFRAYHDSDHPQHDLAHRVYRKVVDKMITTAEPGFSVDTGENSHEITRNACTEVTSADDSDICNLGSLALSRFDNPADFGRAVRLGTLFLMAGSLYSHLPYQEVYDTREKNRRLGLGIMGLHEFLLRHGAQYGTQEAFEVLEPYMDEYARSTEYAWDYADRLGITRPIKTRAVAPNGTIGIIAETTTSCEPIFAAAYKRRVRDAGPNGDNIRTEYVIDPTAKRLLDDGIDSDLIEDAHTLSYNYERRFAMQHFIQKYVDHGISSTVNLPYPITDPDEQDAFGHTLMKYLPELRGITCYPDGQRAGQPITPVPIESAIQQDQVTIEEDAEKCVGGVCGI